MSFTVVVIVYLLLAVATVAGLRAMSRRWRRQDDADEAAPYGPRPEVELDAADREAA